MTIHKVHRVHVNITFEDNKLFFLGSDFKASETAVHDLQGS